MLDRRELNQLRLKYEHSIFTCNLCGSKGIIGEDLKLMNVLHNKSMKDGVELVVRCFNKKTCMEKSDGQLNESY